MIPLELIGGEVLGVAKRHIAIVIASCAVFMYACQTSTSEKGLSEPEIVVTRDEGLLPRGCSVREVADAVLSLGEAIFQGDIEEIDLLFAKENDFASFGVADPGGRTGEDTNDRGTLRQYFESRIANHERLALSEVRVMNEVGGPPPGIVRVDFLASRSADDLGTEPIEIRGWGELLCPAKQIYLLNLGRLQPSEDTDNWCPDPPSGAEAEVVVCSGLEEEPPASSLDESRYADLYGGGPTMPGTLLALPRLGTLSWSCRGTPRRFQFRFTPGPATVDAAYTTSVGSRDRKRLLHPGRFLEARLSEGVTIEWRIVHSHEPGVITARINALPVVGKNGQCLLGEIKLHETARHQ